MVACVHVKTAGFQASHLLVLEGAVGGDGVRCGLLSWLGGCSVRLDRAGPKEELDARTVEALQAIDDMGRAVGTSCQLSGHVVCQLQQQGWRVGGEVRE